MERLYQKLILPIVIGFIALILSFLFFAHQVQKKVTNEIRMREIGYMEESLASYFSSQKDLLSKILVLMTYENTEPAKFHSSPAMFATLDALGKFNINTNKIDISFKFAGRFDRREIVKIIKKNFQYNAPVPHYYFFYYVVDSSSTLLPDIYLLGVKVRKGKGILIGETLYPTIFMNMPSTLRNKVYITLNKSTYKGPYFSLNPVFPRGIRIYILYRNPLNLESSLSIFKKLLGGATLLFVLFTFVVLFGTIEYFKYNFQKKLWPVARLLDFLSGYKLAEFERTAQSFKGDEDSIFRDMIDALSRIKNLVVIDPLTGAFTREYIVRRIEEEINKCRREQCMFSVLYLDFDNFKEINDNFGHLVGDKALEAFVDLMKRITRPYDVIGRMGGDEFVLLLPSQGLSEAMRVAQRILEVVSKELAIKAGKKMVRPKISIGVTAFRPSDRRPEEVIERADMALRKAKESGKNRALAIY